MKLAGMKLYDWHAAPNPKRLRMFMAEKGLEVETIEVGGSDLLLSAEYKAKFPHAMVPMLELADGTQLGESIAICRYLEELYPEPRLLGNDATERAIVDAWERRAFDEGMMAAGEVFRNTHEAFIDRGLPGFAVPVPQIPALVERGRMRLSKFFEKFDKRLGENRFLAGPRFTLADCTLYCSIEFAAWSDIRIPDECRNLKRWFDEVSERPSAKA